MENMKTPAYYQETVDIAAKVISQTSMSFGSHIEIANRLRDLRDFFNPGTGAAGN